MLFPTLAFLLFFLAVVLVLAAIGRRHGLAKLFLIAASYFFYAQWDWRFCFLLAFTSAVTYGAGLLIARASGDRDRRRIVALAVAIDLAVLGYFKYVDFFIGSANEFLHMAGLSRDLPLAEVLLPVGISFFTFHGISYVVDVYRRDVEVCRQPVDMLLYLSFFPQLVAGPIVRASFFLPQLRQPPAARIALAPNFALILGGLFKKVVIANYLATDLVDPVFFDPASFGTLDLLLAAYGYAIQIYCDFSAYSDMAIGIAGLLGYRFPRNFDQPYRSRSLREFWRRWHISLSFWLRDYLYKPLGGNREGRFVTQRNLWITMLLGGIWHGAAWKFVFWGALHGSGLAVERVIEPRGPLTRAARVAGWLVTFHFVCLAWIFFRADSFTSALAYLAGFGKWVPGVSQATPFVVALIAIGMIVQFVPRDSTLLLGRVAARWPAWAIGFATGIVVLAIDAAGPSGVAPFIYFQF